MAVADKPASGASPILDDIDELFNLDKSIDEIFTNRGSTGGDSLRDAPKAQQNATEELGIDEEIKITKKRQPIAKLDISRLLTPAGIPKLRKISKSRLRFRGKGHEFSDVALLLRTYQLWLDDLYPRAKFADGLAIIEKLGHSRQMQLLRKQWIDESKPKPFDDGADFEDEIRSPTGEGGSGLPHMLPDRTNASPDEDELDALLNEEREHERNSLHPDRDAMAPDEDELAALLAEEASARPNRDAEELNEDDLNALLAEEARRSESRQGLRPLTGGFGTSHEVSRNGLADDEAALLEMEL